MALLIRIEIGERGPSNSTATHICVYIYIWCRLKTWSKDRIFWVIKTWSKFSCFSFLFFKKTLFFLQGKTDFRKIMEEQKQKLPFLSQTLVQLCCTISLDQVLTQPWTKLWLNLFVIFGHFPFFKRICWNHYFIVFSAFLKPTPKTLKHYLVSTTALTEKQFGRFSAIVFFEGGVAVSGFLGRFWEDWQQKTINKTKIQNKTTTKKHNHKM